MDGSYAKVQNFCPYFRFPNISLRPLYIPSVILHHTLMITVSWLTERDRDERHFKTKFFTNFEDSQGRKYCPVWLVLRRLAVKNDAGQHIILPLVVRQSHQHKSTRDGKSCRSSLALLFLSTNSSFYGKSKFGTSRFGQTSCHHSCLTFVGALIIIIPSSLTSPSFVLLLFHPESTTTIMIAPVKNQQVEQVLETVSQ